MRHFLVAIVLLTATCVLPARMAAVEPVPPDLSGRWRLDMERTRANKAETKASILDIEQTPDEVRITSYNGERRLGTDVFYLDGHDHKWYFSRIEKVYSRAEFRNGALSIRKYSVLDLFAYQSYTETDRWILSPNRQTLTVELSDGNRLVYEKTMVPAVRAERADPDVPDVNRR